MKRKTLRSVFSALLTGCLLALAVPAFAEYFVIKNYNVWVRFDKEGTMHFTEVIDVAFLSERHGIFRAIPLVNRIEGREKELILEDVRVDGWSFARSRENGNLVLKIGDPDRYVNGPQSYTIHYKVRNGLNFFSGHAEFYWDLLGISWEVPVERFAFDLNFPPGLALTGADVRLYTGPAGATGSDAHFQIGEKQNSIHITGATDRIMAPNEAVTIAVRLPGNAFPRPNPWSIWFDLHGLLLVPGGLVSAVIALLFYSRNRRQAIMVELQPPLDISPAVAGGFIDHSVDNNDVLALVPLLASKGYLRLEVEEETQFWVFKHQELTFHRLKAAGNELPAFEKQFMEALFSSGDTVDLDDLKNKFYVHMNSIRSEVKKWIDAQVWYEPDQRTNRYMVVGAGVFCFGMGIWSVSRETIDGLWFFGASVLLFILSRFFHQRNEAGNRIYKRLEGFRRFMTKVERPVLERLLKEDPEYFDKTLPYAVAFGEVKQWTSLFEGLLSQPPNWYYSRSQAIGGQSFSWNTFSTHFSSEINTINSVFGSSPGSSSSGGGGSSGGGSGGGGGGSW